MQTVVLNVLFIFFQGKIKFSTASGQSGCFEFLFSFSSLILIFQVKSLFFDFSTDRSVIKLSNDYDEKYELVHIFKNLC